MYTQFELPVAHLGDTGHYIPAPARDPDEIARRERAKPGLLLAEQQEFGARVASGTLELMGEGSAEDIDFTADILAVSGINTAWHLFAEGRDMEVMRRNLNLPFLVGPTPQTRPRSEHILRSATRGFEAAAYEAHGVTVATKYGSPRVPDFKVRMGRTLGEASLLLATVDLGDKFAGAPRVPDAKIQRMTRARATRTLQAARAKYKEVGTHPTLAGLADPLSDLRVFIARNAPTGALEAFHEAIAAETTAA